MSSSTHEVVESRRYHHARRSTGREKWNADGLRAAFQDVLAGRIGDAADHAPAAIDPTVVMRVCAVRVRMDRERLDELAHAIRLHLAPDRAARSLPLVGIIRDEAVLILSDDPRGTLPFRLVAASRRSDRPFCVGVGPRITAWDQLAEAVEQATWAAELGMRSDGAEPIVDFGDLGLFGVICRPEWAGELVRFAQARLAPLLEADEDRGSSMLATLREAVRAPNIGEAAAALYIHPSTLRYRLRRIEALLRADLRDPDQRFELEFAVRVLDVPVDVPVAT